MMTSKARKSKTNDWANCFMTYPCCYGSPLLYSVPFFDFIIQNIGHDFSAELRAEDNTRMRCLAAKLH